MNITILDNREVIINSSDNLGTQNENNASIINFSFPESLVNANKKIVFITDDGNYWDLITNNSYKITNAVSKYKNVSVYVWLVDEQNDIDFRSKIWNINFNKNEQPDDIVPTEEQISGFDTMIRQLNEEYDKVEEGLQNLNEALTEVDNIDIDASKTGTIATVTITNKEGVEKSVQIEDGTDYVITPEDYQAIANVVETDITPLIPTKTSDLDNDSGFIDNTVNNLTNYYDKTTSDGKYALITETGYRVELSVDSSTYVMTLNLKNKSGNILNTQTVDLPLETMVVNASYDSLTKEIVLTLQNGNTVRFSVADLVSGLQAEITSSNKLASDLVDDTNQTNKFVTTTEKTTWNAKYDKPSGGIPSTDLSSAVQTSLGKADSAVQDVSGKEDKSNKVTSIDENSTNTQYPGAKLLYDQLAEKQEQIDGLVEENTAFKKQMQKAHISTSSTQLTDSAEDLPIENVKLKGQTSQATDEYVYICDGTETGDYYFEYNNTNYQFTMPTISEGDALVFDGTKLTLDGIEITTTTDNTGTLITLQQTPNPAYPQLIHRVTGNCASKFQNKNWFDDSVKNKYFTANNVFAYNAGSLSTSYKPAKEGDIFTITSKVQSTGIVIASFDKNYNCLLRSATSGTELTHECPAGTKYVIGSNYIGMTTESQMEKASTASDYTPHAEQNAPLTLGNLEAYEGDEIEIDYVQKAGYKKVTEARLVQNMGKTIFTGEENWTLTSNYTNNTRFDLTLSSVKSGARIKSTHFVEGLAGSDVENIDTHGSQHKIIITIRNSIASTLNDFKDYLANQYANNTAVEAVYELATPVITPITDQTLLAQFETLINMKTYKDITNIDCTGEDLAPVLDCDYYQDMSTVKSDIASIKARLDLLEN